MFIVIEGLDGSGKATQTQLVTEGLQALGKKVLVLDYPCYGEKSSYFLERYLNGEYGKDVSAKQASLFFALDRFDDSFNFKDDLETYDHIISNRYVSSSMIHHGGKIPGNKERLEFISWLENLEFHIFGMPKPDKILFLDVPPKLGQKLIEKRGKDKDLHESDTQHLENAYAAAMQMLKEFPDWKRIECSENSQMLPIEIITEKIMKHFH